VLKALLPEVGTDIKGHMRSHAELLEVSGYQNRPGEFNDLLRILDGELRLITPSDSNGDASLGISQTQGVTELDDPLVAHVASIAFAAVFWPAVMFR